MWYPISFPPLQLSLIEMCANTFRLVLMPFLSFHLTFNAIIKFIVYEVCDGIQSVMTPNFRDSTVTHFALIWQSVVECSITTIEIQHHWLLSPFYEICVWKAHYRNPNTNWIQIAMFWLYIPYTIGFLNSQTILCLYILFEYSIKYPYLQTRAIHSCKWYMCVWCLFSSNAYCCSKWVYCINCWISNNCLNARVLKCGYV